MIHQYSGVQTGIVSFNLSSVVLIVVCSCEWHSLQEETVNAFNDVISLKIVVRYEALQGEVHCNHNYIYTNVSGVVY